MDNGACECGNKPTLRARPPWRVIVLGVVTLLTWWFWTDTAAADEGSDGDVLGIDLPVDSPVDLEPVDQLVTTIEHTVSPVVHQAAEPAAEPVATASETAATVTDPAVTAAETTVSGAVTETQPVVGAVQEQSPVPLPSPLGLPPVPPVPPIPPVTPEPGDALVTPVSTVSTTSTDASGPAGPIAFLTIQRARAAESLVGLPAIATNHATRRFEGRSHHAALPTAMDGAIGWQDAASTPAAALATAPPALPPPATPRSSGVPPGGGSLELPERGPLASVLAAAALIAAIQLATRLRALEMALCGIPAARPSFTPD
jgi:hypothetical protein